jgi:hypothetical protein
MELSARQALICAALTGWKGDQPCPWQSPASEETITAWAASYGSTTHELSAAFRALVEEGLFFRVLYPIFAVPVYYCCYAAECIDELPANVDDLITGAESIATLKAFWQTAADENNKEYGPGWMCWGLCDGQGSQTGSSPTGACVGPGCVWFADGSAACHWELPFADIARTGWPDTRFLSQPTQQADVIATSQCMAALQQAAPDFPGTDE